jgi:protein SCO1/2
MRIRHLALALAAAGIIAAAYVLGQAYFGQPPANRKPQAIAALPPPAQGDFSLVDHTGRPVTDEDFRGKSMLVFFGYTYCPDVCPTGLQMMSDAVDILGPKGEAVQPILISVDPERDTPEVLADYVKAFHPRLIGLTGTPEEVKVAAKAYGVRYFKLYYPPSEDDEDSEGQETEEEENADYAVNHTAYTYLMGPDGRGVITFPRGAWPEDMAQQIQEAVDGWKQ